MGQISCASASAGQTATNTRPYIDFASSTRSTCFVYHGRPAQRDANRHMASEEPPTPRSSLGSLPSPRKRVSVLTSPKDRQRAPVDATAQEFNVNLQRTARRWRSTSKELNPAELKKLMATRSGSFRRPSEEEVESPQARSPPSKVVQADLRRSSHDDDSDDGEGIVLLADAEAEAEVRALSEHDPLVRALARGPAARSVDDLKLIEGATADVKFFERLSRDQHLELCRVMTHELVDKESVVFSQGDEGTTFYIIYKGAATVYVPDDDREKGQGSLGQAATALQSLARRRGSVVTADGLRLARQQTCVCMPRDMSTAARVSFAWCSCSHRSSCRRSTDLIACSMCLPTIVST